MENNHVVISTAAVTFFLRGLLAACTDSISRNDHEADRVSQVALRLCRVPLDFSTLKRSAFTTRIGIVMFAGIGLKTPSLATDEVDRFSPRI
jgi:hypothetical protein